jgi:hypothetical protein
MLSEHEVRFLKDSRGGRAASERDSNGSIGPQDFLYVKLAMPRDAIEAGNSTSPRRCGYWTGTSIHIGSTLDSHCQHDRLQTRHTIPLPFQRCYAMFQYANMSKPRHYLSHVAHLH